MTLAHAVIVVVEDELSAAVVKRLIQHSQCNLVVDRVINARGCGPLKTGMAKFKNACKAIPHVLLTDLDRYPCAMALRTDWNAAELPPSLLFNIAVREVEAWLLADREGVAAFLHVAVNKVPAQPEAEADPKRTLINLARRSRKRRLSIELVPELGSAAPIGPMYNDRLSEFVTEVWNVERARERAPSVDRALHRLATFPSA